MKTLFTFFVLFFSSIAISNEHNYKIEGIGLGESLLDFFTINEINNSKSNYYKNNEFTNIAIDYHRIFKEFDRMQFNYKTDDPKLIIQSISGIYFYINKNVKKCHSKMSKIADEISKTYRNSEKFENTIIHDADKSGKSKYKYIMILSNSIKVATVICYDFSKEINFTDFLSVNIRTEEFNKFLDYAYD